MTQLRTLLTRDGDTLTTRAAEILLARQPWAEGNAGLRFIQISAPEGTLGTAQAATEVLLGRLTAPADDRIVMQPEGDERSSMARFFANGVDVGQQADFQFTGDVMFRHLVWWLHAGIRGNITATQPDVGNEPNAYLWTFEPSLSAANTPDKTNGIDVFTVEWGDDLQAYETEYTFARRIEITGAPGELCQITVDLTGRKRLATTKTASLSVQTIQRAPFNLSSYYRDTSWSNLGNTQKTAVFLGFNWVLDTAFTARVTGDGNLYFSSVNETTKSSSLTLTLVRGTESDALRTLHESNSTTYVRVKLFGSDELDSGRSNVPYLVIDGAYHMPNWPAYGADGGTATVEVPLTGIYDSTGTKTLSLAVYNALSAIPT